MRKGEAVLTPFPFTNLMAAKVRPAVAVSRTDRPGEDVILPFVSSARPQTLLPTDLSLDPTHPDFAATGLKVASVIKGDKLATAQRRVLLGELGALSPALLNELDRSLRHALEL